MKINIRIDGAVKEFEQNYFALEQTIAAMKYLRDNEKAAEDMVGHPTDEQIEKRMMNEAEAMVGIFSNQFNKEQFIKGFKASDRHLIEEAIVLSLGDHEEEEKKEQSTLSVKPTNNSKNLFKGLFSKGTR